MSAQINFRLESYLVDWIDTKKTVTGLSRGRSGFVRDLIREAWRHEKSLGAKQSEADSVSVNLELSRVKALEALIETRRLLMDRANRLEEWAGYLRTVSTQPISGVDIERFLETRTGQPRSTSAGHDEGP